MVVIIILKGHNGGFRSHKPKLMAAWKVVNA